MGTRSKLVKDIMEEEGAELEEATEEAEVIEALEEEWGVNEAEAKELVKEGIELTDI